MSRNRSGDNDGFEAAIYAILFLIFAFSSAIFQWSSQEVETFTPTRVYEKAEVFMVDGKTSNGEYVEFEMVDSWWFLHFGSGTVKNQMFEQIGKPVTCDTVGARVNILSWYENVRSCNFNQ